MTKPETSKDAASARLRSRDAVDAALPILALVLVLLLGFTTVQPFLPAMLWGVFLSVSLRPWHQRLIRAFNGRRGAASIAIGLLLTLVLLLPILGLSRSLIAFVPEILVWFSEEGAPLIAPGDKVVPVERDLFTGEIKSIWQTLLWDLQFIRDHFQEELRPAVFWLIQEGRLVGVFVAEFALGVLLATILLHRAENLGRVAFGILEQMGGAFAAALGRRAVTTIRSTVLGLLGSAAAQTGVASFAYFLVGVPHWPILSLLTFVLGMIQIGPILIWLPIAIWLWSNGAIGMAIFMVVWGLIVIGLTDNLVKSLVVARGAQVPAFVAFLGAIGGLLAWGVVGIFLGPVILAVCYELTIQWIGEEETDGSPPEEPSRVGDSHDRA